MQCATSAAQIATSAAQRAKSAVEGTIYRVQENTLGAVFIYLLQCSTNSLPGLITHKTSAKVAGATTLTIPALHLLQYIMRWCYELSNSFREIDTIKVHPFSDHAASPRLVLLEGLLIYMSCLILSYYFDKDCKADGAAYNGLTQLIISMLTWLTHTQAPCARTSDTQYNIENQMHDCMDYFRCRPKLFGCNTSYEDTGDALNAKLTKEDSERANQMSQRAEENLQLYCNSN